MNKGSAIIAIAVAFVGGLLIGHLVGSSTTGESDEDVAELRLEGREGDEEDAPGGREGDGEGPVRFQVPVTNQPIKGPPNALVTIVEFSEFECPFCSRVQPTLAQIQREYGDKVRIVFRNNPLPFHQNAGPAAQAALEAFDQGGSEKFFEMHDILFQNQRELTRANLESYAERIGLNMEQFRAALDNNEHQARVQEDQQLAQRIGAQGTPNFYINGRNVVGAQPFEAFKSIIDEEVRAAEALVESGTPRNQVYAALTRNGRTSPAPEPGRGDQPQQPQQRRPQPDPAAVYRVPVDDGDPWKGAEDALVTIVQLSDFECPFCSRVEPTVDQILEHEAYRGKIRVVWFNNPLPFHQNAGPAAQAALEALDQGGNDKFWEMHAKLFEHQRELTRENLETYAQELNLNMGQFRAALDNNEHAASIERHQTLARSLGATGTPAFFINGRNLRGAQPFPAFQAVIDEELRRAEELVRSGTPRSGVYEAATRDGHTSQQMLAPPPGEAAPEAPPRPAEPDPNTVYELDVPTDAPWKGGERAEVVIQEFSEFQCPFCSRVTPTVAQILETYGNRVKVIFRHYPLPFHQNAGPAAQAAIEVFRQGGNDKFWAYHDVLFQHQQELTRENLERWAQELGGINMAQFRQALDTNRHQATIDRDMAAMNEHNVRGTPSFFINGRLIQGAQPFENFRAAIDRALAE